MKQARKQYFVEHELQFWFIFILILLISIEGVFVGYGISRLFNISFDWQRPDMAREFFKTLLIVLILLIGINFIIGLFLSNKIAGPLHRLRTALYNIREGDLSSIVQLRPGDILKDFFKEFNETVFMLNKLVNRDRELVRRALEHLNKCQGLINGKENHTEEYENIKKLFVSIRSYLIAINSHFKSTLDFCKEDIDYGKEDNTDN